MPVEAPHVLIVPWCHRSFNNLLRQVDIDEKCLCSLGSNHNRLLLEFSCSGGSVSHNLLIGQVLAQPSCFGCRGRVQDVAALFSIMQKLIVWKKCRTCAVRKPWWDAKVRRAWQARCEANRQHRLLVMKGDKEACLAA